MASASVSAPRTDPAARPAPTWEEVEALRRQVVELQRISSLGVLAGSISHELNNALTPILNYAKLGLRNPDPDFHRRAFEKILDDPKRAEEQRRLGLERSRKFDWDLSARMTLDFYRKVLGS